MKNKITEKIFDLIYTDSLTETYNRKAYDERLHKLRRNRTILDSIMVAVAVVRDLKQLKSAYGQNTADEAVRIVAETLKKTIGERADIFRISEDTFVCISDKDIKSNVMQFMDYIKFENTDRAVKIDGSMSYLKFNPQKHSNIDDLIKNCEKKICDLKRKK